jgi:hypothetical protein
MKWVWRALIAILVRTNQNQNLPTTFIFKNSQKSHWCWFTLVHQYSPFIFSNLCFFAWTKWCQMTGPVHLPHNVTMGQLVGYSYRRRDSVLWCGCCIQGLWPMEWSNAFPLCWVRCQASPLGQATQCTQHNGQEWGITLRSGVANSKTWRKQSFSTNILVLPTSSVRSSLEDYVI